MSLAPNVDVDFPKNGLDRLFVTCVRFTRLNRLKNSALNCAVAPSVPQIHRNFILFSAEKSVLAKPGPRNVLRPRFPCCPRAGAGKSDALKIPLIKSDRERPLK